MSDLDQNFHGRFLSIVFYGRNKPAPKFSAKSYDWNVIDLNMVSIGEPKGTYCRITCQMGPRSDASRSGWVAQTKIFIVDFSLSFSMTETSMLPKFE